MKLRPSARPDSRKPWYTVLAVLLGALANMAALGVTSTVTGGVAAATHNSDSRTPLKPTTLRPDTADPSFEWNGFGDAGPAIVVGQPDDFTSGLSSLLVIPATFNLPVDIDRDREGRPRAPPQI